jgi:hypothetical protein
MESLVRYEVVLICENGETKTRAYSEYEPALHDFIICCNDNYKEIRFQMVVVLHIKKEKKGG